jgi:hypothetical protein
MDSAGRYRKAEAMTVTPITPDVPGRGLWTLKGGLLPVKPGSKSRIGYYRLAAEGEVEIGSAWVKGTDKSDSARTVWLAVRAFQAICGMSYLDQDGWLGPKTSLAGTELQRLLGIEADGVFGPVTMKAAFGRLVNDKADLYSVPRQILNGIAGFESGFDPAAVGVNGWDHGLCQINLDPKNGHGTVISTEQACDPGFALDWTARTLKEVFNRTYTTKRGISIELAWDVAILNHNSPKNAAILRDTGKYPTEQAKNYVAKVREYR